MQPDSPLTLAAAQITSAPGDVDANAEAHLRVMEAAADAGVDVLIFPELSLTGYELALADALQTSLDDERLLPLQTLAAKAGMLTKVGMPMRARSGKPYLGALVLGGVVPRLYAKMHLHDSETDYFQPGNDYGTFVHKGAAVAAAICADLTHASHAAGCKALGADIYAVGALINEAAWAREEPLLAGYAREHGMAVIFANHASQSGDHKPVGMSSIWAPGGDLVARADSTEETLVVAEL